MLQYKGLINYVNNFKNIKIIKLLIIYEIIIAHLTTVFNII